MTLSAGSAPAGARSRCARWALGAFLFVGFCGFVALGVWQLERRTWKLALIERVETRVHAPAVAAPGPPDWPALTAESAEYRHVTARGQFVAGHDTFVQAVTDLGAGFWVLSPLRTDAGFTVLVNRGFVPPEKKDAAIPPGEVTVTGLLRMTEPKGGFLRANAPTENRWYSRDVSAISTARGLANVAPYFIDAEADPAAPANAPTGGLTVVAFRNTHLSYALTWFGMALLVVVLSVRIARAGRADPAPTRR